LAWEAETAASHLPIQQEEYISHRITHAIEKLYKQQQQMAEVVYSLLDCDSEIRLKVKCVPSDLKYKLTQSERGECRESVSESSALELKLDIDELQELYTMCTRPSVRTFYHN
jgi:hypothetical protein